jgi:hypothetical protein
MSEEEQETQDYVIASTNTVRLLEWEDTRTGLQPADWTVVLTAILDSAGTNITGTTNIAMPYVDPSPGFPACYEGVVPSTASLVAGACTTRITATAVTPSGTAIRRFDVPGTILTRPPLKN